MTLCNKTNWYDEAWLWLYGKTEEEKGMWMDFVSSLLKNGMKRETHYFDSIVMNTPS